MKKSIKYLPLTEKEFRYFKFMWRYPRLKKSDRFGVDRKLKMLVNDIPIEAIK